MIFSFKKKQINLDCFTNQAYVHKYAPICHASSLVPEWWRQLPSDAGMTGLQSNRNMKTCAGFVDLYGVGVMLPMWSDLRIALLPNGEANYQYSDGRSRADFHVTSQRGAFAPDDLYLHMKLVSPWVFYTKEDINWVTVPAMYAQPNPGKYITCIGSLSFKYQHSTNVNLLLPRKNEETLVEIKHGEPMMHMIPMSDKRIKINNHLVDDNEWAKLTGDWAKIAFSGSYWKQKRIQKSKCPF